MSLLRSILRFKPVSTPRPHSTITRAPSASMAWIVAVQRTGF
jgi:hypothetical protein